MRLEQGVARRHEGKMARFYNQPEVGFCRQSVTDNSCIAGKRHIAVRFRCPKLYRCGNPRQRAGVKGNSKARRGDNRCRADFNLG